MSHSYRTWFFTLPGLTATLILSAALGCHSGPPPPPLPDASQVANQAAAAPVDPNAPPGAKVYAANGCAACHSIDGDGGHSAPQLSQEGLKHDADWIIAQVKDPKSHNSGSRMPAYADKIQMEELKELGDYLASLKPAAH